MSLVADPLSNEAILEEFIQAFEAGTIAKPAWTHTAHLTVGGYYALRYPEVRALARLRAGIRFLNKCQGVPNTASQGYHGGLGPTDTVFMAFCGAELIGLVRSHHPRHPLSKSRTPGPCDVPTGMSFTPALTCTNV